MIDNIITATVRTANTVTVHIMKTNMKTANILTANNMTVNEMTVNVMKVDNMEVNDMTANDMRAKDMTANRMTFTDMTVNNMTVDNMTINDMAAYDMSATIFLFSFFSKIVFVLSQYFVFKRIVKVFKVCFYEVSRGIPSCLLRVDSSMFTEYFMGVSRVFHGSHGSYPSTMSACFMIVHYEIAGWLGTLFGSPHHPHLS